MGGINCTNCTFSINDDNNAELKFLNSSLNKRLEIITKKEKENSEYS